MTKEGEIVDWTSYNSELLRYLHLIPVEAGRFSDDGLLQDDREQEGIFGLVNANVVYDSKKGPFPVFARKCIRNKILDAIKARNNRLSSMRSLDHRIEEKENYDLMGHIKDKNKLQDNSLLGYERKEFVDYLIGNLPNTRMQEIFRLRYVEGVSPREIGDRYNLSKGRVWQVLKQVKNILKQTAKMQGVFSAN